MTPPTLDEVLKRCYEKSIPDLEGKKFHSYWESRGWSRKGDRMKNWEASLTTWSLNIQTTQSLPSAPKKSLQQQELDSIAREIKNL